jgi:hypothetical protein
MSNGFYTPKILPTFLILEMVNGNKDNDDGAGNRHYLKDARGRIMGNRQNLRIFPVGYLGQEDTLSSLAYKKVRREMGTREYKLPYIKRLNCTKKPISDAFIEGFVDLVDRVLKSKTVELVFQMFLGGGSYASPDPSPSLNSICHRDITLGIVFDCFYRGKQGLTNATKFQDEMQNLLREFSGTEEIRMLWGSFGDTDISKDEIRKLYYDDDTWSSLQKVKKAVDNEDLFSTEFTVKLPPG